MGDAAASALSSVQTVQFALSILQSLNLIAWRYPPSYTLTNGSEFDFIVVGGGSAGSVLANRLSANSNVTVLLIEQGGYPPFESEMPGLFVLLPSTTYDHNTTSVNDNCTAQNLQGYVQPLTQGNMLGGSSALNHMIYARGHHLDFQEWSETVNDSSWDYENLAPYFKKAEKLIDQGLLASENASLLGTDGMVQISRQVNPDLKIYLQAFAELGNKIVDDITSVASNIGFCEPLFTIGDGLRQSNALCYLSPAKKRPNLYVATSTTATKILIKDSVAIGVQVTTSNGEILNLYAKKEVLVCAGAINSPKLLMLSGIGPRSHLESLDIDVIADLPVGQNFQDQISVLIEYQMNASNSAAAAANPHTFPVPTITGYAALNTSQARPDYRTINLVFPHDSAALLQLCANVFKYSNEICNIFYEATSGRTTLVSALNLLKPKSRGQVKLASTDPTVAALVFPGAYNNSSDLTLMAQCLEDFDRVRNTTYFRSVNATLVDTGLCTDKTGSEFWTCYALAMSAPMWHYTGTCAMGSVLDSSLRVKGVDALRVVDASSMPTQVGAHMNAAVTVVAERGADLILSKWNITV